MRAIAIPALVASVLLSAPLANARAQVKSSASEIRLRPGDAVRLEVKDEPTLTAEFPIGLDGAVLLPLVGTVPVAGRPFSDVSRAMQDAIAREIVNPVMRVTPLVRVAVLGEVRTPGLFLVDPTQRLADVIALAGGLTNVANTRRVILRSDAIDVVYRYEELASAPPLVSGDQVRVEKRSWVSENLGVLLGAAGSLSVTLFTAILVR